MSIKEFDMCEYTEELEQFKIGNEEKIMKYMISQKKIDIITRFVLK